MELCRLHYESQRQPTRAATQCRQILQVMISVWSQLLLAIGRAWRHQHILQGFAQCCGNSPKAWEQTNTACEGLGCGWSHESLASMQPKSSEYPSGGEDASDEMEALSPCACGSGPGHRTNPCGTP
eukprot:4273337-Amphidinium_carterae.1